MDNLFRTLDRAISVLEADLPDVANCADNEKERLWLSRSITRLTNLVTETQKELNHASQHGNSRS
jgi:hypothetical protein